MSKLLVRGVVVVLAIFAVGCSSQGNEVETAEVERPMAADNTGNNAQDRDRDLPTVMEQGQSGPDLDITQAIRQAIVGTESLSMNAKNVKVITRNGEVALRGPVESESEKATIARIAEQTVGVTRVFDMLEVKYEAGD